MKKLIIFLLFIAVISGCKKDDNSSSAPTLPPYESLVVDFGEMGNATKSATVSDAVQTKLNWTYAALSVSFWNVMIGTTFAVPAAAFKTAFSYSPEKTGLTTWQWSYTVDGFTSSYSARLVGTLESSQVKWEMYITKTGVNPFDEFLWFEGSSALDGNSGQWILHQSADFPDKAIQVDWEKTGDEVGQVKYTYVRELDDSGQPAKYKGSYLIYGLQDKTFDAYVNIHVYNDQISDFADANIEWSRTDYSGHVMSQLFYGDSNWHCWDSTGNDVVCE